MMAWIEKNTKFISLISLFLGAVAALMSIPLDQKLKSIEVEAKKLQLLQSEQEMEMKKIKGNQELKLQLYTEVKSVLEKKERNEKQEEAVRVLVDVLADDPFREKLLQAIALGASAPSVKKKAKAHATFYEEEGSINAPSQDKSPYLSAVTGNKSSIKIDFFYCSNSNQALASSAKQLQTPADQGRWRVRYLPEEINSRPGYSIYNHRIRYNSDELDEANAIKQRLESKLNIKLSMQEIEYPTPNYISVFLCGAS